jgi:hypothetical protein
VRTGTGDSAVVCRGMAAGRWAAAARCQLAPFSILERRRSNMVITSSRCAFAFS